MPWELDTEVNKMIQQQFCEFIAIVMVRVLHLEAYKIPIEWVPSKTFSVSDKETN